MAFVGHTDVVPPGDLASWKHPPFAGTCDDGWLYGRGAVDMKSAIAAFIVAAQNYEFLGSAGSLMLLVTGDEEEGSPQGMRAVVEHLKQRRMLPDVGLIGEASNEGYLGQGMRVGRRGSINVAVEARGIQGHVAWPTYAKNAALLLVSYLAALQLHDFGGAEEIFPETSMQVTNISVANQANNVIPDHASARFNIRFNRRHSGASLHSSVRQLAATVSSDLNITTRICGEPYKCEAPLLGSAVDRACFAVTGHTPTHNAGGGVSDGRFLHKYFPLLEFGLVGDTAHQVNERVAVEDLRRLSDIYLQTLRLFFKEI